MNQAQVQVLIWLCQNFNAQKRAFIGFLVEIVRNY